MRIFVERKNRHLELKFSGPVSKLLEEVKVNPQTVLVVRDGELLTPDREVSDKDEIKLLSVISGG